MSQFAPNALLFYAHTADGGRPWELLSDHLYEVGHLAKMFASGFGAAEWGWLAGLWHDLGKYSQEFQQYLRLAGGGDAHLEESPDKLPKVNHSSAGAIHADQSVQVVGRLLAYVIAGHHAGLPDGISPDNPGASLEARLSAPVPVWQPHAPADLLAAPRGLKLPARFLQNPYATGMWLRMLFSCLVDADFLSTEAFMSVERHKSRTLPAPSLAEMEQCVMRKLESFGPPSNSVGEARASVVTACLTASELEPGLFSLTVPTGGGKTLSSLAFALKHARLHALDRVIYAIPFTSIIEQNASVFRDVFASLGDAAVLEHHSNLDPDATHVTRTSRLAAENWDAPLIVTTNGQFFESLHAAKTSRCRKLHRIARSVIILDEAQTLPLELLNPCLRALEQLVKNYGCSVVLCTATQPSLHRRHDFRIGLEQPREIIPEPGLLYQNLARVTVENLGQCSDAELTSRLLNGEKVLCIVNTRRHAAALYRMLGKDTAHFHLSTRLCPEHRSARLTEIKGRLLAGLPCRVISTQLIEAGVDIDFPVVYRALAGLDSIAQAAGRCNREGKLVEKGRVLLFTPEHPIPKGFLRQAAEAAAEILPHHADPLSLHAVRHFFERLLSENLHSPGFTDTRGILDCFATDQTLLGYQFRTCAEKFQFIETSGEAVIVPWGTKGRRLCEQLENTYDPSGQQAIARRLQRFIVQVFPQSHVRALAAGAVRMVHERFPILIDDTAYDNELGLMLDDDAIANGSQLII